MSAPRFLVAGSLAIAGLIWSLAFASGSVTAATASPSPSKCRELVRSEVITKGKLTVATNNPALWPWFVNGQPSNDKGYESQLSYQLAAELGFKAASVVWVDEPYEVAVQPGSKPFDFDVNEVIYKKSLTKDISFSSSYFNVDESLVALKADPIVRRHTPAQLQKDRFGALAGSPGLAFLRKTLKPKTAPIVYSSMTEAIAGLEGGKIDALVLDTPTGHYLVSEQLTSAVQFGQFHTSGTYYAAVLQKGDPLDVCLDVALSQIKRTHQLERDSKADLKVYNSIPFLKP